MGGLPGYGFSSGASSVVVSAGSSSHRRVGDPCPQPRPQLQWSQTVVPHHPLHTSSLALDDHEKHRPLEVIAW